MAVFRERVAVNHGTVLLTSGYCRFLCVAVFRECYCRYLCVAVFKERVAVNHRTVLLTPEVNTEHDVARIFITMTYLLERSMQTEANVRDLRGEHTMCSIFISG